MLSPNATTAPNSIAKIALVGAKAIATKHNLPLPVAAFSNADGNKATIYRKNAGEVSASIKIKDLGKYEVRIGDNKVTVSAEQ